MSEVIRKIELRQLVGVTDDGTEVRHKLDEILLNGVRAGYVGHGVGEPINIIRPGVATDQPTMAEIRQAIAAKLGGGERKVYGVPELTDEQQLDIAEGIVTRPADDAEE